MIEEGVHHWSHHISEDILANEVNGVLNDYDTEVDELMHEEGNDRVVMVEVGLSEMDVSVVYDWIKVSILIELQVGLKINLEVLEY